MEGEEPQILDIDTLNAKQKLKEFKTTAKEIKSKEVAKRAFAIEKVKDERYFLQGGCLVPLIDSMVPKKKTLDLSKMSLECLLLFQEKCDANGEKLSFPGLQTIFNLTQTLDTLQILCDVMSYHEEVKKKKKKATAETEEVPVDKNPETIRYFSMQIMSNFAQSLFQNELGNEELVSAFARIPNLLSALCKTLFFLFPSIATAPDAEEKSKIIKGCQWVLNTLIIVLRHGANTVESFLSFDGILGVVLDLCAESQLTLPGLLVIQYLSSQSNGLEVVQESDIVQSVLSIFEKACSASVTPPEPAVPEKPAKGGKKGAPKQESPRPVPVEEPNHVGLVATGVKYFTAIAQYAKSAVLGEDVNRVVRALAPVMFNQVVVNKCVAIVPVRQDPDLHQFMRESAILLGCYGLINEEIRNVAASESGAVRLLLRLLRKSSAVYGAGEIEDAPVAAPAKGKKDTAPPPQEPVEVTPELMEKIYCFRHVCEKALLHLLTRSSAAGDSGGDEEAVSGEGRGAPAHSRWPSCHSATVDWEALKSTLNLIAGEPEVSNISLIVESINNSDEDIGNRAVRLFSVITHSSTDQSCVSILEELELDAAVVKNLSEVLLKRVVAATRDIDDKKKAADEAEVAAVAAEAASAVQTEESGTGGIESDGVDEVKTGEGEIDDAVEEAEKAEEGSVAEGVSEVEPTEPPLPKISLLSSHDVLSHILCCLKYFLESQSAHIKAFSSEEQISSLADLLFRYGPVARSFLSENSSDVEESSVRLLDPRHYSWDMVEDGSFPSPDEVIIREIVFDSLTIVAEADTKYRSYGEAELPQQPGTAFPESTCECGDEAMFVFKRCANPCLAVLMKRSTFKVQGDFINAAPSDLFERDVDALSKPVCESALRLLVAIGSAGVRGMGALYSAVAQKSFEQTPDASSWSVPAMKLLKEFFHHKVLVMQPVNSSGEADDDDESQSLESIDAPYSWKLPLLCELELVEGRSPVHYLQILRRKDLWPFLTLSGALLGILSNPQTTASTMTLAEKAVQVFTRVSNVHDAIQPSVVDIFSGCLLGIGGVVSLGGCVGRFGPMVDSQEGSGTLSYIINRGLLREKFWKEWAESQPSEAVEEPVKGGKGGKKDAKVGKKDAGKKGAPAAPEADMSLPFEPDDSHPDPNHGPDVSCWKNLLNVCCDDLHGSSLISHPLVAALQAGLSSLAIELISAGAMIDQGDERGVTPIEHALVLGNHEVSRALIDAGADVDCLDSAGNPAIKYAFFSLPSDVLLKVFDNCRKQRSGEGKKEMELFGEASFVEDMISAGVDLNVCDSSDGNYPLHHAIGVGRLSYTIGGVSLQIRSSAHIDGKDIPVELIQTMAEGGAPISAVNRNSISALHVLAALGDVKAAATALKLGATPNIMDSMGYMPIHYAAASCTANCIEMIDTLLKKSVLRPSHRAEFENIRTGKTKSEKYEIDSKKALEMAISEAECPQSVKKLRLTLKDILKSRSDDGISASLLALCGNVLSIAPHHRCLVSPPSSWPEMRIRVFTYFNQLYDGPVTDLVRSSEDDKITPSLALALLLAEDGLDNGGESADSLFDAIPSIVDICFDDETYNGDAESSVPTLKIGLPSAWGILHAAIISNSEKFLKYIWDKGLSMYKFPYVHFIANNKNLSEFVISETVTRAALTPVHGSLLNAALTVYPKQPLHIATECRNEVFLKCMLALPQVEPNVTDAQTGRTAIHVACAAGDADLAQLFMDYSEAVDITLKDNNGENCVETVVKMKNASVLAALLDSRRMEVVEQLLSSEEGESLLLQLERENVALCELMGIVEPLAACSLSGEEDAAMEDVEDSKVADESEVVAVEISVNEADDAEEECPELEVEAFKGTVTEAVLPTSKVYGNPGEELDKSDAVLREVVSLLHDLNLTDSDMHAHKCFHDGVLYREHCSLLADKKQAREEEQKEDELAVEGQHDASDSLVNVDQTSELEDAGNNETR